MPLQFPCHFCFFLACWAASAVAFPAVAAAACCFTCWLASRMRPVGPQRRREWDPHATRHTHTDTTHTRTHTQHSALRASVRYRWVAFGPATNAGGSGYAFFTPCRRSSAGPPPPLGCHQLVAAVDSILWRQSSGRAAAEQRLRQRQQPQQAENAFHPFSGEPSPRPSNHRYQVGSSGRAANPSAEATAAERQSGRGRGSGGRPALPRLAAR